MSDPSPLEPAPSAGALLPPRFWLSLWLIGCGYMLLMMAIWALFENDRLMDVWWWTAIPFAWLAAGLIHWRHWSFTVLAKWKTAIGKHPGYAVFLVGMALETLAFGLVSAPSVGDSVSPEQMRWFEIGSGAIVVAAVSASLILRRRDPQA